MKKNKIFNYDVVEPSEPGDMATVPWMALKMEKEHQKRKDTIWLIIVLSLLFVVIASNTGWFIYESQMEQVTETVEEEYYEYEIEQDNEGGGDNKFNLIGRDGKIINGEAKSEDSGYTSEDNEDV